MPAKKNINIFPSDLSERVKRLKEYPAMKSVSSRKILVHFCLFMEKNIIHFRNEGITNKLLGSIIPFKREAAVALEFQPELMKWDSIYENLTKRINPGPNADRRTGFRMDNDFLVKNRFTFGLKLVREGTAHVVQTLNVPVLFYLKIAKSKRGEFQDRSFDTLSIRTFDRRMLRPNGCYRIPPGTEYILYTYQKTFFRFDVVREKYQIPFDWVDPVEVRVTTVEDEEYGEPVKTPGVSAFHSEKESSPDPLEEFADLVEFSKETDKLLDSIRESDDNFQARGFPEPETQNLQNPQDEISLQPPVYYLVPLERNVVVSHPDFVRQFQDMAGREFGDPRVSLHI